MKCIYVLDVLEEVNFIILINAVSVSCYLTLTGPHFCDWTENDVTIFSELFPPITSSLSVIPRK